MYHESIGNTYALFLNTTDAKNLDPAYWNNTSPSSSVFTLGTGTDLNENTKSYIAYLFAEKDGFSRFDKYTGNGSADGPFVWTGFKPKFVLTKRTDIADHWIILDSARDNNGNYIEGALHPHLTNAEVLPDATTAMDFLSNGFKWRYNNSYNVSGGTYIYAAFAEVPFNTVPPLHSGAAVFSSACPSNPFGRGRSKC